MKKIVLMLAVALGLTACGTTAEDREAWRATGLNLALVMVDALREIGVNPGGTDDRALRYANAGCRLIQAGAPIIVVALNKRIIEENLSDPEGPQTEPVTIEEMQATFSDACIAIAALLEPVEPPAEPVPADVEPA